MFALNSAQSTYLGTSFGQLPWSTAGPAEGYFLLQSLHFCGRVLHWYGKRRWGSIFFWSIHLWKHHWGSMSSVLKTKTYPIPGFIGYWTDQVMEFVDGATRKRLAGVIGVDEINKVLDSPDVQWMDRARCLKHPFKSGGCQICSDADLDARFRQTKPQVPC